MSLNRTFDPDLKVLFVRADGVISFADVQNHFDEEEKGHFAGERELVDASTASTDLTEEEIRAIVRRAMDLTRKRPFGPTAITTSNDTVFGMSRDDGNNLRDPGRTGGRGLSQDERRLGLATAASRDLRRGSGLVQGRRCATAARQVD